MPVQSLDIARGEIASDSVRQHGHRIRDYLKRACCLNDTRGSAIWPTYSDEYVSYRKGLLSIYRCEHK